jgi:hypothetical protein
MCRENYGYGDMPKELGSAAGYAGQPQEQSKVNTDGLIGSGYKTAMMARLKYYTECAEVLKKALALTSTLTEAELALLNRALKM